MIRQNVLDLMKDKGIGINDRKSKLIDKLCKASAAYEVIYQHIINSDGEKKVMYLIAENAINDYTIKIRETLGIRAKVKDPKRSKRRYVKKGDSHDQVSKEG